MVVLPELEAFKSNNKKGGIEFRDLGFSHPVLPELQAVVLTPQSALRTLAFCHRAVA